MWWSQGTFWSWLGACLELMALLSQGEAWKGTWASPILSKRKQNLVDFCMLSFCRPFQPCAVLPKLPQWLGNAAWRLLPVSDHSQFVLIIASFHLPLPFHTSGQANWGQLWPCPSPTLPQKPCWAFCPCCSHMLPQPLALHHGFLEAGACLAPFVHVWGSVRT